MEKELRRFALLILLLTGLGPAPAAAQSSEGTLAVRVLEGANGSAIAGALVRVEGTPLFAVSDSTGTVRIAGLDPGRYEVTATSAAHMTEGRAEVEIRPGESASIEVRLSQPVFELPSLVVTANRGAARFGETSASMDVLRAQDLERLGALTADDALRFASGVIINAGMLDIRGATGLSRGVGSRVLVMLDGHRFLSGTTGEVSFEALPSLGTERIEVVKGPASTLYGSAALGGVVNVIRRPVSESPETSARLHMGVYDTPSEFDFTDQTLAYGGLDVRHARKIGPLGAFLEVGRRSSDGYRENGGFEWWLYNGGLTLPREEGPAYVDLAFSASNQEDGHFFTWLSADDPLEVEPDSRGDLVYSDQISLSATVVPVATGSTLLRIRPGVYRADIRNRFHDNDDFHRSNRYQADVELSLHHLANNIITIGAEGAYTPVTSNILGEPTTTDAAAFVQDEITLNDRLSASAGIRVDHRSTDPGASETQVNPRLGLLWRPGGPLNWRASVGRGYRAPSPTEQFVSTRRSGFDVVPNLELRGESSWAFEIGGTGRLRDWLWVDLGLFESRFDDLIEASPVPGQLFTFQFRNVQDARVRGADISARLGLPESSLSGQINYLLLDAEDLTKDAALPYRSKHLVTMSMDWGRFGVDFQHRSRVEQVLAFPLDQREAISLLDVRASFRVGGVRGQIKIANLLQETYVNVQERDLGPSRSFQLTLMSGS